MPRTKQPTPGRKSASVSLYPRDLAAVEQIIAALTVPGGPAVKDSEAIRDAIQRHPAVTAATKQPPPWTEQPKQAKTRNRKET